MYTEYFVNVNTGELYRSGDPKNNKCDCLYPEFNVEGWSRVGFAFYKTLKTVQGFGFVMGVKSESESQSIYSRKIAYNRSCGFLGILQIELEEENMNESQLRELIELQSILISLLKTQMGKGYNLDLLKSTMRTGELNIQKFIDSLPCNMEFSDEITDKGYFKT